MIRLNKLLTKYWYILGLAALVLIYHKWFLNFGYLTHGDWNFYFKETMSTLRLPYFNLWLSDTGFGRVLIDVGQAPTYFLYGVLSNYFNVDYSIAERLVHMWPTILLASIGSYMLAKEVLANKLAAISASIFYSFNTYLLQLETGHLTLAAACACSPLALYMMINMFKTLKLRYIVLTALTFSLSAAYEPRVAYILIAIFFMYAVYEYSFILSDWNRVGEGTVKRTKRLLEPIFASGLFVTIFGLINFYWIYGISKAGSLSDNEVTSRGLFGNSFYDISHALALHTPFWTGKVPTPFIVQNIPVYFWIIPIVVFAGAYLQRRNRTVLFFAFVSFVGLLLSKQVGEPLTWLYSWLYNNLPGFNAFREASKFYLIIGLGYMVLVGAFAKTMLHQANKTADSKKYMFYVLLLIPLVPSVISASSVATNGLGTLFINRTIPAAYMSFKNMLSTDNNFSRTYWVPISTRWTYSDVNHPYIHGASIADNDWKPFVKDKDDTIKREKNVQIFNSAFAPELFTSGSIKYVVVPPRQNNDDEDLYEHHGFDRQAYVDRLDKVPFLKKIQASSDLTVYENKQVSPYVSSTINVIGFDQGADLDVMHSLISRLHPNEQLGFSFKNTKSDSSNLINATLPFSQNTAYRFTSINPATLYQDSSKNHYQIQPAGDVIKINTLGYGEVSVNGTLKQTTPSVQTISSAPKSRQMYIGIGDVLYDYKPDNQGTRDIGVQGKQVGLYSAESPNLVANPSFEQATWRDKVEDCNNYDTQDPGIAMSRSTEQSTDGKRSLKLMSNRHTACASTDIDSLEAGASYKLSFDYKTFGGHEVSYELQYNDAAKTVATYSIAPQSRLWTTQNRLVTVPQGATAARLYLKVPPDDRNQNASIAYFDEVAFRKATLLASATSSDTSINKVSDIMSNDQVSIKTNERYRNMVPNSSFENGLWQKNVGDCNEYDSRPEIKMSQDDIEKSDGSKSLALSAKRHTACTSQKITVSEGAVYKLSFDYKGRTKSEMGYSINFDDAAHTSASFTEPINNSNWTSYQHDVVVPIGATSMYLTVYGYPDELGLTYNKINYDNFNFTQLPYGKDSFVILDNKWESNATNPVVSYVNSSQTSKSITIKNAKNPFYLTLSEAYHDKWALAFKPSNISGLQLPNNAPVYFQDKYHYKFDDYLNSWYVDSAKLCAQPSSACTKNADGSYDMKLVAEFTPQRYFYVGLIVSGVTLAACLGYLAYSFIRRRSVAVGGKAGARALLDQLLPKAERPAHYTHTQRRTRLLGRVARIASAGNPRKR